MTDQKSVKKTAAYIPVACFAGYTACYAARNVLSIIKPEMVSSGAASAETISLAISLFFLSYGFGQLINGLIGDYVRARTIISAGLGIAALVLFAFPTAIGMTYGSLIAGILWCVCGFALSMLWGPMTKVVAENLSEKAGVKVMTALNVASILGRLLTSGICAWAAAIGNWPLAYYVAGAVTLIGAVGSFLLLFIAESKGMIKVHKKGDAKKEVKAEEADVVPLKQLIPVLMSYAILPMILISFMNGILRNAVTAYIPTYISNSLGASPTVASILSGISPFVELAGTFAGLWILNGFKGDELKSIGVLFGFSILSYVLMNVFGPSLAAVNLFWLFASSASMSSACNLIYSKYCLRFADTGRASVISGGLDFVSYIAAAIATPLFDLITGKFGETMTVYSWAIVALLGGLCALWAMAVQKKTEKKTA